MIALLAQAAQPASPGSSPEHWTTFTFGVAGGISLVAGILLALAVRQWVYPSIEKHLWIRVLVYLTEAIAAIVLSVVSSYFDVFKKTTYIPTPTYQPDWHVVAWACAWGVLAVYYLAVKFLAIYSKESEDKKSKKLTEDLAKERAAKDALTAQRNLLAKIASFAKEMVQKKIKRLSGLIHDAALDHPKFVEGLNPKFQIQAMIKLMHEFFDRRGSDDAALRVGIWMLGKGDRSDRMVPVFAWDGEKEDCFHGRSTDRMKIADPGGTISEVVRSHLAIAGTIKIIPDCPAAAARGEFTYFYPEQQQKLGSMVLYKHVFSVENAPVGVVVMLASSKVDHFRGEEDKEIKQFLDETMMRIEMEWIVLELVRKMNPMERAA